MTVRLIEGWDHFTDPASKGWQFVTSGQYPAPSVYRTTPRLSGGYSWHLGIEGQAGSYEWVVATYWKLLPSTYTTLIAGFAIGRGGGMPSPWNDTSTMWFVTAGRAGIAALRFNSAKQPYIVNGSGTTIATCPFIHNDGEWHYYEIKLVINGASGSVEMRVDGGPMIGATTGNFGSTACGGIAFETSSNAYHPVYGYHFDDVYVVDTAGSAPQNTFLGDIRVGTVYPTGEGSNSDFTPNSGTTHYTQVDEDASDGSTTTLYTPDVGDKDSWEHGDINVSTTTIYAVQANLVARKDDANTRQIRSIVRQGGTDYDGATVHTLSTSYATYSTIMELDPVGAAWSVANLNADEFGVKVSA